MEKANKEIRNLLKEKHVPFWRLAEALDVSEGTVIRWMRTPLTPDRELRIRTILNSYSET